MKKVPMTFFYAPIDQKLSWNGHLKKSVKIAQNHNLHANMLKKSSSKINQNNSSNLRENNYSQE